MAKKDIQESQQSSQGIALGTQGNQAGSIPDGVKGTHQTKDRKDDRHIPNQDRSAASDLNQDQRDKSRH
jgi:hypothetical protein